MSYLTCARCTQLRRADGRVQLVAGRRDALRARGQLDVERWADDGGSLPAEAMAVYHPRAAR